MHTNIILVMKQLRCILSNLSDQLDDYIEKRKKKLAHSSTNKKWCFDHWVALHSFDNMVLNFVRACKYLCLKIVLR